MNYLTKAQMKAARSRLTRAEHALERSEGVEATQKAALNLAHVAREEMRAWRDGDFAFPDQWHRWKRAEEDGTQIYLRLKGGDIGR